MDTREPTVGATTRFTIQRSENANVVQYDVQLTPEGKLNPKEPIIAHWVMLGEERSKPGVSFAFGRSKNWAYRLRNWQSIRE